MAQTMLARSVLSWRGLRWEILGVLAVKMLGLTLLYYLFFAPSNHERTTGQAVARHLALSADAAANFQQSGDP